MIIYAIYRKKNKKWIFTTSLNEKEGNLKRQVL